MNKLPSSEPFNFLYNKRIGPFLPWTALFLWESVYEGKCVYWEDLEIKYLVNRSTTGDPRTKHMEKHATHYCIREFQEYQKCTEGFKITIVYRGFQDHNIAWVFQDPRYQNCSNIQDLKIVQSVPRSQYCIECFKISILYRVFQDHKIVQSVPRSQHCRECSKITILYECSKITILYRVFPRFQHCLECSKITILYECSKITILYRVFPRSQYCMSVLRFFYKGLHCFLACRNLNFLSSAFLDNIYCEQEVKNLILKVQIFFLQTDFILLKTLGVKGKLFGDFWSNLLTPLLLKLRKN